MTSAPPPGPPPSERLRAEALDWFVRRNDAASFGADDERAFQAWLAADAAHGPAFAAWHDAWNGLDALPPAARAGLQGRLAIEKAAAPAARTPAVDAPTGAPAHTRRRFLVPAAVAGLGVVGAGWLGWTLWDAQPVFAQRFQAARGEQREVALPDGSQLRLDSTTRLDVVQYRARREVVLHEGQATFSVQHDASRPFRVLAGALEVVVVGTRFAVRHTPAVPGREGVRVAVESGRVRVTPVAPDGAAAPGVELSAGQQVQREPDGRLSAVTALSDADFAPWRAHRVRFDNARLDEVFAELARYSEVRWLLRDPAVAALRLTGVFDPRDLKTFQRVLPQSLPVRVAVHGDTVELWPAR